MRGMKIIVTGASGFLGREVCLAALRRGHELLALGGNRLPVIPGVARAMVMDLCQLTDLESLMLNEFPHAVINCAALPTIEACLQAPAIREACLVGLPGRRYVHVLLKEIRNEGSGLRKTQKTGTG